MYLNKIQIIGNITRDPELKALPSGVKICTFSVATNETYKDKAGNKQERVEFHNIVCFGKTGENVATYMKKGSQIYIDGKLQTRTWDDKESGKKMYRTEILANIIQFGSKPQGQSSTTSKPAQTKEASEEEIDTIEYPDTPIDLEDIPF